MMNTWENEFPKLLWGGKLGSFISEGLSFRLLDLFYEYGGTVLDTARSYSPWKEDGRGKSEQCIGKWIEENNNRNNIVIVTKGGINQNQSIDNSKNNLLKELDESLRALRTDYVDVYLLHKDDINLPVEEIVDVMQYLKEHMPIKKLGICNMRYERFCKAVSYAEKSGENLFSILQTWWSLAEYTTQMWNDKTTTHMNNEMYTFLKEKDIICMGYTSQCKGYFQKMALEGREGISPALRQRIETERNIQKALYIKEFCRVNQVSPTAFVNGYITSNPLKGIAIVSCSEEKQLLDIMNHCDYVLPREIIEQIDSI